MIHYLDNASTTKVSGQAAAAVLDAMTNRFGNPSSVHAMGVESEGMIRLAREAIATSISCKPEELLFTSGGTEADNLALIRGAESLRRKGRHIISTSVEHPAVSAPLRKLLSEGYEVSLLEPDSDGRISVDALSSLLREDTVLLSMMLVNNETGVRMPVQEAAKLFKAMVPHGLVHTDAIQGYLKMPISVRELGVDLLSLSAHKVHGPKGCGALYIRDGVRLKPLLEGGGQERGLRSGTEAVQNIAGFGAAVKEGHAALHENLDAINRLRMLLCEGIRDLPRIRLIAANGAIVNFALLGLPSEVAIRKLQDRNIFVSAGSACARGKPSRVLKAMRMPMDWIRSSIRVSFSWTNTKDDVDALLAALKEV